MRPNKRATHWWNQKSYKLGLAAAVMAAAWYVFSPQLPSMAAGKAKTRGYIDTHMHLQVARGPQGPHGMRRGPRPNARQGSAADALVELMDRYGVSTSIIVVVPSHAGGNGDAELQAAIDSVKEHPGRLVYMGGGSHLNPIIQNTDPSEVTEKIRAEFQKNAAAIIRAGATGFGEMLGLHICMSERHSYQFASPDHPLYLLLADLAAKYDVPIDLHTEAISEETPTPENLLSACSKNPAVLPATVPALERLLAHNRKARIVWQHIGWDNTGGMTVGLMRRLLAEHPNLFLALRAEERLEQVGGGGPMPNRIVDGDWRLKDDWIELFNDFPDRFMIGGDEFVAGKNARAPKFPQSFEETWSLMDQLSDTLAQKIGRDNAARVYRLN